MVVDDDEDEDEDEDEVVVVVVVVDTVYAGNEDVCYSIDHQFHVRVDRYSL